MTGAAAVAEARALIAARFASGRHHLAAATLTDSGALPLSLNVETRLGWAALCAEQVAHGAALTAGTAPPITFAATADRTGRVVAPCGRCRELPLEHAPDAEIAVAGGDDFTSLPLRDLLPHPYAATDRGRAGAS